MVGYFSKERVSPDNHNVACILTLPPYQVLPCVLVLILETSSCNDVSRHAIPIQDADIAVALIVVHFLSFLNSRISIPSQY